MNVGEIDLEYLLLLVSILLICIILNLGFKLQIFKSSKEDVAVLGALFVIGSVLDSFAVIRGYWSYNVNMNFFCGNKNWCIATGGISIHDSYSLFDFNNLWNSKKTSVVQREDCPKMVKISLLSNKKLYRSNTSFTMTNYAKTDPTFRYPFYTNY